MNERTKNYLGWAIILGILIGAGAVWRMAGTYAESTQPGAYRSFAVSGEGKATGQPDIAYFTFAVINDGGKDISALQKDNTARVNAAIEYLKSVGISKDDIKTEGYNVEPRYQSTYCGPRYLGTTEMDVCPPASIVGYTIRSTVSVKVRQAKFDVLGDVLAGVVTKGANTVSQLTFTVDDPIKLENEARAEAMAKAQAKAEALAEAGNFRLGRLLSIDECGGLYEKYGRGGDMAYSVASAAAPAPTIEPGSQDVNVSLMLRYEIK
ncbi:MAG: SIMPL domain-containing protein [Patescibacteria group bacterium]